MDQINSEPKVLRPPFKRSAEAKRLEDHLADKPEGHQVSYQFIKELIGEDPQTTGYMIVYAVRKRLLKEGAVWYVVPGEGLKKAAPDEVIELVDDGLKSVRRKVTRTNKVLNACAYDRLEVEEQHDFNNQKSTLGILSFFLRRPQQKKLKENASETFDPRKILKLFGGE
jgi:hypothetical protein